MFWTNLTCSYPIYYAQRYSNPAIVSRAAQLAEEMPSDLVRDSSGAFHLVEKERTYALLQSRQMSNRTTYHLGYFLNEFPHILTTAADPELFFSDSPRRYLSHFHLDHTMCTIGSAAPRQPRKPCRSSAT